jgi:hypothetical protein
VFEDAKGAHDAAPKLLGELAASRNEGQFLDRFNAFVGAAQNVLIAILREGRGARLPGFDVWYSAKRDEMAQDDVLMLVHDAADYDFDARPHRLRFATASGEFASDDQGRRPKAGAWWQMTAAPALHVAIDNAPGMHGEQRLVQTDPMAICELISASIGGLIDEATEAVSAAASDRTGA